MTSEISFLIIVPTLNSSRILGRLIESLKEQTYENWRLVLIDGNSSKYHQDWLKDNVSSDNRIFLEKEKKGYRGIYPSMNLGTKFVVKSDWVIFLGSDDWFASKYALEIIFRKILNEKYLNGASITIFNSQLLEQKTNKILRFNKIPTLKKINKKSLYFYIFFGYMPAHQSACFSYIALKELIPYSDEYKLAADCNLFLKALNIDKLSIFFIDEVLINIQAGGISSKLIFRRIIEVILIYQRYFVFYFFIPLGLRYLRKVLSRLKNIF